MNRYDHTYRGMKLPPPISDSASIRQIFAESALVQHRSYGFGPEDDDELFRQFDFSGVDDYWTCALSEPMDATSFAQKLNQHFFSRDQPVDLKNQIKGALRIARHQLERWFIEDPANPPSGLNDISTLKLRPLEAATWMLGMPRQRHLVPPSLRRHLQKLKSINEPAPTSGRPPGTGYEAADRPIVTRMIEMVSNGEATSPTRAAWLIIGRDGEGALGNSQPEAKIRRLVERAKKVQRGE